MGSPCCFECAEHLLKKIEEMRRWKAANVEKNRSWSKSWAKNNREKVNVYANEMAKRPESRERNNAYRRGRKEARALEARKYRLKSGDKVRSCRRRRYQENNDVLREYRRQYIKDNPWFNRAASSRKRALVRQRMPAWADLEALKDFYRACPDGMVVDHIIPLKGKTVSGLHIACNLQYLTEKENGDKSNKFDSVAYGLRPVTLYGKEI